MTATNRRYMVVMEQQEYATVEAAAKDAIESYGPITSRGRWKILIVEVVAQVQFETSAQVIRFDSTLNKP